MIINFASSNFSSASEQISQRTRSVSLTKKNYDVPSFEVSVGLHATYLLFFSDVNQNQVLRQILVKVQNMKFYETLPVGAALLCVKSGTDGRTDVTTLIVAFYNCRDCASKKNPRIPTALTASA
jgi:hypothetical protein